MKLDKTLELLEKLRPLEKEVEISDGIPVQFFEIVPLKYVTEKNIKYDPYKIILQDGNYYKRYPNNIEFTVIGFHFINQSKVLKVKKCDKYLKHL